MSRPSKEDRKESKRVENQERTNNKEESTMLTSKNAQKKVEKEVKEVKITRKMELVAMVEKGATAEEVAKWGSDVYQFKADLYKVVAVEIADKVVANEDISTWLSLYKELKANKFNGEIKKEKEVFKWEKIMDNMYKFEDIVMEFDEKGKLIEVKRGGATSALRPEMLALAVIAPDMMSKDHKKIQATIAAIKKDMKGEVEAQ